MNLFMANLNTLLDGGKFEPENATYFDFIREEEQNFDANKQFFAEMLNSFSPKIMYEYQVGVVDEYNISKFIGVEKF